MDKKESDSIVAAVEFNIEEFLTARRYAKKQSNDEIFSKITIKHGGFISSKRPRRQMSQLEKC